MRFSLIRAIAHLKRMEDCYKKALHHLEGLAKSAKTDIKTVKKKKRK